jgi:signal transduction histidine kinase
MPRYVVAVLAVAAAFALSMLLAPVLEADVAPIYLAAVMVSAWRGGLGAGLLATAMSSVIRVFFFLPPHYSFTLEARGVEELGLFVLAAVIISSLSAAREEALGREQVARREAEAANAVKDEFLAAVSHELRTPLTTIKTLTRILLRKETTKQEQLEYLGDIASECDRQIDLVNNLLDLSRIRAGGVPLAPRRVDAGEVVQACERILRVEATEHGHELSIAIAPDLPYVCADHAALRRALCSVVENAIKYTADGGRIEIDARADGDAYVAVDVADTGRGIRPEDAPRIFDSFFRGRALADAPAACTDEPDVPGIGLGLYLARVLVEGMNGTIAVRSRPGEGSTFTLRIPVWQGEPEGEDERRPITTRVPVESA